MNADMQIIQHGRPKFVAPTESDFTKGRRLYVAGKDFDACTSADMQLGFRMAAGKCEDGYWLSMMKAAVN